MDGPDAKSLEARRQIWWLTNKRAKNSGYGHMVPDGWVRTLRVALGISNQKFAKRLGISPASISALEASEARGSVRIETLRRAATALGCELTYAFVPSQKLSDALKTIGAHSTLQSDSTRMANEQWKELIDAYLRLGLRTTEDDREV